MITTAVGVAACVDTAASIRLALFFALFLTFPCPVSLQGLRTAMRGRSREDVFLPLRGRILDLSPSGLPQLTRVLTPLIIRRMPPTIGAENYLGNLH